MLVFDFQFSDSVEYEVVILKVVLMFGVKERVNRRESPFRFAPSPFAPLCGTEDKGVTIGFVFFLCYEVDDVVVFKSACLLCFAFFLEEFTVNFDEDIYSHDVANDYD